jgi:hypothetical protein
MQSVKLGARIGSVLVVGLLLGACGAQPGDAESGGTEEIGSVDSSLINLGGVFYDSGTQCTVGGGTMHGDDRGARKRQRLQMRVAGLDARTQVFGRGHSAQFHARLPLRPAHGRFACGEQLARLSESGDDGAIRVRGYGYARWLSDARLCQRLRHGRHSRRAKSLQLRFLVAVLLRPLAGDECVTGKRPRASIEGPVDAHTLGPRLCG